MRTLGIIIVGFSLPFFNIHSSAIADEPEPIDVGVAQVDITPREPIRLSGYESRKTESVGVESPLSARALAIGSDCQGCALIITVDNLGIPASIADEVAARIKKRTNIPRERIAFSASHTHSAPVVSGVAPNIFGMKLADEQQAKIDRYSHELADNMEAVAIAAVGDRKPARLSWSSGSVGFAINRRVLKDKKWTGFGEIPKGPVDHDLPILRAVGLDGSIRAILFEYACHCTTLDPKDNTICADWMGYARNSIEKSHPGAIALGMIGCAGDANPKQRTGVAVAKRHGSEIGDEIERLLKKPWIELAGPIECRFKRVALPLDRLPTRAELETLSRNKTAAGYNARTQLAKLDRGESLQKEVDYPVQTWRFGDRMLMVFLGGEVVVDYSIRLKRELDAKRLWVVAYSNDVPCYIASERILSEGGYEAVGSMDYYAKPTHLAPGIEQRIIDAVRSMTPQEYLVAP